jgi:hypothetical protein
MCRKAIGVAVLLLVARAASADVIWSDRGTGPNDPSVFAVDPSFLGGGFLEDGTFGGPAGPHTIGGVNLGYFNGSVSPVGVDVLVNFYDTVDYSVLAPGVINSGPVGGTYRFHFTAAPGTNETGFMNLPSLLAFPDSTFGMVVRFVNTGTSVTTTGIEPIFFGPGVQIGSSDDDFGADTGNDGSFDGTLLDNQQNPIAGDVYTWGSGAASGNLYFEISSVPEPALLGLIGLAGLTVLGRRK